ncbi:MAG TPA: GTPase ObgE [Clostridia bacterium]|nr:GTPase ObgE [Clostridia bacterium]
MYIDKAEIKIIAGKGGNGSASFRREKFEPKGGPDGGDGGRGGNIIARVDLGMHTLMDFRYKRKFVAEDGKNGQKKKCHGRSGKDIYLSFPQGTVIFEKTTGKLLADLSEAEAEVYLARGGRGGKGNVHFKSSTNQAPDYAQRGLEGEEFDLVLELKSIADVGLVGFPNVGKSSLLSTITKARPKIDSYPFTTLTPNLGVVEVITGKSFIMADIPGIIEGASDGIGLGHDFLRHIERTRLLVHLVDIGISHEEGRSPLEDYQIIRRELESFSEELSKREEVVLLNKLDVMEDESATVELESYLTQRGIKSFRTSTITGQNLAEAMKYITTLLEKIEPIELYSEIEPYEKEEVDREIYFSIVDGEYCVEGQPIEGLMHATDFLSYQSEKRFQVNLKNMGIYDKLKQMGIKEGDTVRIMGYAFEYKE